MADTTNGKQPECKYMTKLSEQMMSDIEFICRAQEMIGTNPMGVDEFIRTSIVSSINSAANYLRDDTLMILLKAGGFDIDENELKALLPRCMAIINRCEIGVE